MGSSIQFGLEIKDGRGIDGPFQNLQYTYDKVGNVTGLENPVAVTGNRPGGPVSQSFGYDKFYRLTTAGGGFTPRQGTENVYSLTMAYDAIHNIKRKNQLHEIVRGDKRRPQRGATYDWSYAYDKRKAGPHAPVSIGDRNFTYDANGNQLGWSSTRTGAKRVNSWDEDNRLRKVVGPQGPTSFSYDDSGQRLVKLGIQGETVYVNQFYVVRNGAIATKHVFAGTARVASKLTPGATAGGGGGGKGSGGPEPFPGQGQQHRSERAGEVAQDVVKNPNLQGQVSVSEVGAQQQATAAPAFIMLQRKRELLHDRSQSIHPEVLISYLELGSGKSFI